MEMYRATDGCKHITTRDFVGNKPQIYTAGQSYFRGPLEKIRKRTNHGAGMAGKWFSETYLKLRAKFRFSGHRHLSYPEATVLVLNYSDSFNDFCSEFR